MRIFFLDATYFCTRKYVKSFKCTTNLVLKKAQKTFPSLEVSVSPLIHSTKHTYAEKKLPSFSVKSLFGDSLLFADMLKNFHLSNFWHNESPESLWWWNNNWCWGWQWWSSSLLSYCWCHIRRMVLFLAAPTVITSMRFIIFRLVLYK